MHIVNDFLTPGGLTVIFGKPSCDQAFLAEEVAFAAATGIPAFGTLAVHRPPGAVVVLADGVAGGQTLLNRFAAWRTARNVALDTGEIIAFDMTALRKAHRHHGELAGAFFAELKILGATPAVLISTIAAGIGFHAAESQIELALLREAIERTGAAALFAGHTAPGAQSTDCPVPCDTAWKVDQQNGRATLTKGESVMYLTAKVAGGHGHVVTRIFDVVREIA